MIDRLLCARGSRDVYLEDYTPDQAIMDANLANPEADELAVIFPPWHDGGQITKRLVNRLTRSGTAVLNLQFHDQMLEPDVERVLQSHRHIRDRVTEELQNLQDEMDYQRIHLIAISLGNVAMSMVAESFADFSRATCVLTASDLAASMWEGQRTQNVRRGFEQQDVTKLELVEAWAELAPQNYASAFRQKETTIHISETDKIIPTYYQHKMRDALEAAGSIVIPRSGRIGHAGTIVRFCMAGGRI